MARISVVVALLAFVAVAFAQNAQVVDDFLATIPRESATLRISAFGGEVIEDFACDATNGGSQGRILGGCHVMQLDGFAASGCEPTGSIANGDMFCNNGFGCNAQCLLQLDGTGQTAALDLGLNTDLNSLGFAFRIFAATDVQTTFTVRVHDTNGAVSRASATIPQGSSSSGFIQYEFAFATDFSGSANFDSVGAIEIVVPAVADTDVVLNDWDILSNEADLFGAVFVDCDCDLISDAEDSGVANVEVTLTGDSSCTLNSRTTTTDSAGSYSFIGLPSCTYTVSIPASSGTLCAAATNPRTVVLTGTSVFNVNFGIDVPTAFTVPARATVFCNEGRSPQQLGEATSSQCGSNGAVSFVDTTTNVVCDAEFTIVRTWSDNAGNQGTQTITVLDTNVAPTFTNADASTLDIVLACNACTDAGTCVVALNAVDDCSVVTVTHVDGNLASTCDVSTCTQDFQFVRTWSAVDDCGNQAANQGQVIIQECADDVIVCPPTTISTVTIPSVPTLSIPTASIPSVTIENPPTRNCRFICDDDDSSASALVASLLLMALFALAAF